MTMRNYDTTSGKPYPRVARIEIDFAEDGSIAGIYKERMAVVIDGKVLYLDTADVFREFSYSPADYNLSAPIVAPSTGAETGATATVGGTVLAILALIRRDQKLRDGA